MPHFVAIEIGLTHAPGQPTGRRRVFEAPTRRAAAEQLAAEVMASGEAVTVRISASGGMVAAGPGRAWSLIADEPPVAPAESEPGRRRRAGAKHRA